MKAEINNENKAKFFALYWGQDVLCSDMYGDGGTIYSATMKTNSLNEKWLFLKPLSQISDEDAVAIAKILFGSESDWAVENWIKLIKLNLTDQFGSNIFPNIQPYFSISWSVCDYLRSKGYALPWMDLTVDEMIEAGWIKLKVNE